MNLPLDRDYTLRILKGLATHYKKMDAYKQGIIDGKGKVLKKMYQLKSNKERNAYTHLDRLIITLKKVIDKQAKRGDYSVLKTLSPALWLVREYVDSGSIKLGDIESRYNSLIESDVTLTEEEIAVQKFLDEEGVGAAAVGGAPTNNTGGVAALSKETGGPAIHKKDIKKFRNMARRSMPGLKQFMDKNKKVKEVN